ncbi:UNVERIFIED_CONTAM: hypothetical protein RMT77_009857 [Armadillidium vulgare]
MKIDNRGSQLVDFGHVLIPGDLDPPKKHVLAEFKRLAHSVRSGNVTILDAKTFYIPNLHYDGRGPDAYFWVGKGSMPNQLGRKVPNEMNSYDVLRGYEGEDIEIQLPDNLTVYDIDYIAIWCVEYRHNFGHVLIPHPSELWVPPALGQTRIKLHPMSPSDFSNCREINEDMQVQWQARDDDILIRLIGRIGVKEYMAFGISLDQDHAQMVNSDVVVVYYDENDGSYHAVDYSITGRAQCDGTLGVCPDERVNGRNDAEVIGGKRHNGITSVTYSRPYKTTDMMDIPIEKGSKHVGVIAAIGTLNTRKEANHHDVFVTKELHRIDFSSVGENSCTQLIPEEEPESYKPWPPNILRDTNNFTVDMGPTGGERGYKAITGNPSWGKCFWINGMLIPEIHVERGQTYYFTVEGGNNIINTAKYHPFYITESSEGGYSQKTIDEQQKEKVFAGITISKLGVIHPTAQGRICEWKPIGLDSWQESSTFEEYRKKLHRDCEPGIPGELVWNVTEDTPDLVYYQCYTHRHLGWKIHVHDPGFNLPQNGAKAFQPNCLWMILLTVVLNIR